MMLALLTLVALPLQAEVVVFPAPQPAGRELVVYSSLDSPLARPLVEAFQTVRPDIAVRYVDLLTGEIAQRVTDETDAGQPTADLVFSSAMDVTVKLANDGYAREARVAAAAVWPDWAAWRSMVFALTFEPGVIVYHRPSFPNGPPDTRAALMDWLDTAPKGVIGTYDISRSAVGYLYLMRDMEHFADLWPLVRAMGRAGVQTYPTSQDVIDGVNSGKLHLGYNVLGSYAADQAARLPNIGLVLPRDYVVVISRVALVPRAAANPELGEAFLAFLMSRDGQTVLAERLRLPAVSLEVRGKDSAAAMQEALGAKLRPVAVSPGLLAYLDAASRAQVLAQWNAALEGSE
ncbi:ABC transporter substrate-binding protein [Tabrizicola aquatica]|uniref:ABC transporter substrate-binding protein n=1 Tax=Tabrizicola aquatica TaxID=909926 RepID=UPI001FEB5789|nr:ABC transporter substrate-binding protein [Tabrizicola aquatica]